MTQSQLDCAVALATGEDPETISRLGFSLADPHMVQYDPEPCDTSSARLSPLHWTVLRPIAGGAGGGAGGRDIPAQCAGAASSFV